MTPTEIYQATVYTNPKQILKDYRVIASGGELSPDSLLYETAERIYNTQNVKSKYDIIEWARLIGNKLISDTSFLQADMLEGL